MKRLRYIVAFVLLGVLGLVFFFPKRISVAPVAETRQEIPEVSSEVAAKPEWPAKLKTICSCESTGYPDKEPVQYETDGKTVLRGRENPDDVGMCQINTFWHLENSKKMGFDIFTAKGNREYAIWLFDREGETPWLASKETCWRKVAH